MAQAEDADLATINASYAFEVARLRDVIETAGTFEGGSAGIALDNLLSGATQSYDVLGGTVVEARGSDLISAIVDNLPDTITVDNATDLVAAVDETYADALDDAVDGLTRDRRVIAFAAETLDPLGALDARITALSDQLSTLIDGAAAGDTNLLSPYASDLKVTLDSLGSVLTIDAQDDFGETLGAALDGFRATVLSGGSIDDRIAAVNDALFTVGRTQTGLQAESAALAIQRQVITSKKEEIEGDGGSIDSFLSEQDYSPTALKFIERYLVQKDLESAGVTVGSTDAKTAMVSQLGSILPSGSGISLSLLV